MKQGCMASEFRILFWLPSYRVTITTWTFPMARQEPCVALAGRFDSVRWAWQATAPTHGTCLAHTAPDSSAFAPLHIASLRSRQRTAPLAACFTLLCSAARNRRDRRTPGQRITGPSSGNARKLADLRCDLGHALAPNVSVPTAQNPVPAIPATLLAGPRYCAAGTATRTPATLDKLPA
jgi:hypothetical protein